MPPKGKKGGGGGGGGGGDKDGVEETRLPLQAVLLADPFETRFNPFTLERPRVLLPLANLPLIEYTLEFLANAGVEEVFVYCGAHTDQVQEYIDLSKWLTGSSPFSKLEVLRSSSHSIGDAMRDLDSRALLVGDFLLVYGDVVSNLPLEPVLSAHRARRAADKNAIMTMVLREAGTKHRTKAQGNKPVFVIDPTKDRCLHFEQMPNREQTNFLSIDAQLLADHPEVEVRQDLIDCGIDICTPDVLALWSDNFDFQAPRKGFLHSVLKDYELNGKTIHTHIVSDHYAARVRNLHSYDSISKDIVSRWAYPLCPDSNLVRGHSYRMLKGAIYKEEGVMLARSCVINRRTVIGKGTYVGEGSVISDSIIGRHCHIGKNVTIEGAYIWDHAVVKDGTVVKKAIVANEAVVGKNCYIEPGALISYGVAIGDGTTIDGTSRITRARRKREERKEVERGPPDYSVVGEGGDGFEFEDEEELDEDEVMEGLASTGLLTGSIYNLAHLNLSADSISTLNSESDLSDGGSSTQPHRPHRSRHRSSGGSFVSMASADTEDSSGAGHAANFDHDAASSVYDSLVEGHESANIQLELTSLRMSTNASEHQVRRAVALAFVKHILTLSGTHHVPVKQAVATAFGPHKDLLVRTMFDRGAGAGPRKPDQVDFLLLLQQDLAHRGGGDVEADAVLLFACMELYKLDVIEQEAFEQWWADPKSVEGEAMRRVRERTRQFIDFLVAESSSEESSEEESSEEEEEEESEEEEDE